jgi:hypothetical protein
MSWYLDHNILNEYNINLMDIDDIAYDIDNNIFKDIVTEEELDLVQNFFDLFFEGGSQRDESYKLKPVLRKTLLDIINRKKEIDEAPLYELD